jgi:DNA-damage-inducible protein J
MITLQTRITEEVKAKADALFAQMGLSTTDAVRMFLMQSINYGGLPFTPSARVPNAETLEALNEKGGQSFDNLEDLYKTWK